MNSEEKAKQDFPQPRRRYENDVSEIESGMLCGAYPVRFPRGSLHVLNPDLDLWTWHMELKYLDHWCPLTLIFKPDYPMGPPTAMFRRKGINVKGEEVIHDGVFCWRNDWSPAFRLETALVAMLMLWEEEDQARKAQANQPRPLESTVLKTLPTVPESKDE